MFCSQCGAPLPDTARFCSSCGAAVPTLPVGETKTVSSPAVPAELIDESAEPRIRAIPDPFGGTANLPPTTPVSPASGTEGSETVLPLPPPPPLPGDPSRFAPPLLEKGKPRPWRRWFARVTDETLAGIVAPYFLAGGLVVDWTSGLTYTLIGILIWAILEGALLHAFGTTPGKWLFKLRVLSRNGENPELGVAVKRGLLVWLKGLGLGIPVVTFVTQIYSYFRLKSAKTTSWDEDCQTVVIAERFPALRFLLIVGVFLLIAFMLALAGFWSLWELVATSSQRV